MPTTAPCPGCSIAVPTVRFAAITDARPVPDKASWSAVRKLLSEHAERPVKGGPLWSPTVYAENATRGNEGVVSVTAFVGDVDDGTAPALIQGRLAELGLEYVIHSTHSSTTATPKYRVAVPLAAPVPRDQWSNRWAQLNQLLTLGHSDPATKDPARAFYLPSCPPGGHPFVYAAHGRPADVAALLPPDQGTPLPSGAPAAPDFGYVSSLEALLQRVQGFSGDGPVFRRLLETTRGEPRAHETNLLLTWVLYKCGATVPQIARLVDWPESNVSSTVKRFRTRGAYSYSLKKVAAADPVVSSAVAALPTGSSGLPGNPWSARKGWEEEPLLPILQRAAQDDELGGDDEEENGEGRGTEPVEPGYVLYNRLIAQDHFRPFRTFAGDPRVAVPTEHGLEIWNPAAPEFVERVGYQLFSVKGRKIPTRALRVASSTLTSRALSRSLPRARVLDLWLRVAPAGPLCSRVDMVDEARRCIFVGPDGWRIEEVGDPVFDVRHHMLPLPVPTRAPGPSGDWTRVNRLWRYVLLPESDGVHDQRMLALADLVQTILAPASLKPVKVLSAEEGTGKSTMMGRYQSVLDPSTVPHMKPPAAKDDDAAMNIAVNHATVNFDNVSSIAPELSDYICRITSGTGLVKRKLYSDSEETVVTVWRSVLVNGITATPRMADLLRRVLFLEPRRPAIALAKETLDRQWAEDHPEILGGLLDLAVATARVLRDEQLPPESSNMADYVRIGRAMAVAMGKTAQHFQFAWDTNVDLQNNAAASDPYVGALFDFFSNFTPATPAVRPEAIAAWILANRASSFPKGTSPQHVGNAIARWKRTLERMGVYLRRHRDRNGMPVYFRADGPEGESGASREVAEGFGGSGGSGVPSGGMLSPSERQDGRDGGYVAHSGLLYPPDGGVPSGSIASCTLPVEVPSRVQGGSITLSSSGSSDRMEPRNPLSGKSGAEGESGRGIGEETDLAAAARHEARKAAFGRSSGAPAFDSATMIEYPDGTVMDRASGERIWSPGDDPAQRPLHPPEDPAPPRRRRPRA